MRIDLIKDGNDMGNFKYSDLTLDFVKSIEQADTTKRSLRDISSSTRNLLENLVLDIKKLKRTSDWKILHGYLHTTSAEVDAGSVHKSILNLFHMHIQNKFDLSEELYIKLTTLANIEHDLYYDENPSNTPSAMKSFEGMVLSKKLVSTKPFIYEYIFRKRNKSKKLLFLSNHDNMINNCLYKVKYNTFSNMINQKRYFIHDSTFVEIQKDDKTNLIDDFICRANSNSRHLLSEILNDFETFMNLFGGNLIWPEGYGVNRIFLKILQIISNPWSNRGEIFSIADVDYTPFVTNPFIGHAPKFYINKSLTRKILEKINPISLSRFELNESVLSHLNENRLLVTSNDFHGVEVRQNILNINSFTYKPWKFNDMTTNSVYFNALNNLKKIKDKNKGKIIIAPAGYGKSFLVKAEIDKISNQNIMILTPTWKASEVYSKYKGVDNIKIRTIQGCKSLDANIEYDLVVFDEISMYGFDDWETVTNLKYKDAYFIGDIMQLDPIRNFGLINHLFALNFPKLKTADLKINHRIENSKMKDNLKKINEQIRAGSIMDATETYEHILSRYSTYNSLFQCVKDTLKDFNKEQPNSETKIIIQRNQGTIGVRNLNNIFINRNEEDSIFQKNDEIIITEDTYQDYFYLSRNLKITKVESIDTNTNKYSFKSTIKTITSEKGEEPFEHALAITAHRSQGQTIDNVIVIIDKNTHLTYRWLYTAISRAGKNLKIYIPNNFNFSDVENNFDDKAPKYINEIFKK